MKKPTRKQCKRLVAIALILIALAVLALVIRRNGLLDGLTKEAVEEFIAGFGVWGPLVFMLIQFGQVVISFIPGNLTTVAGGALFGLWRGFFYSFPAVIVGSMLSFWMARKLGVALVRKIAGERSFDRYYDKLHSEGALSRTRLMLVVTMALPFFPSDLICLLTGLTALPPWQFFVIIVLARPWGLLVSALVGAGTFAVPVWVFFVVAPVSIALGVLAFRHAPVIEGKLLVWLHRRSGSGTDGARESGEEEHES